MIKDIKMHRREVTLYPRVGLLGSLKGEVWFSPYDHDHLTGTIDKDSFFKLEPINIFVDVPEDLDGIYEQYLKDSKQLKIEALQAQLKELQGES